jgi:hypothetical protein
MFPIDPLNSTSLIKKHTKNSAETKTLSLLSNWRENHPFKWCVLMYPTVSTTTTSMIATVSIDLKRKHSPQPIEPHTTPIQNIPSDNHLILTPDRHRFASNHVD